MMLNASNKFEGFHGAMLSSSSSSMFSGMYGSQENQAANAASKAERESIHSGQFMVSHFEAEEAQDDLLDDSEVKMLDPEDPSLAKLDEPNPCREVKLYVPRKVIQQQTADGAASVGLVTSHLEIETSLTKLFKCMTLAYSQKLTSPKWNHFKGVRLRWKDKIRLNNVIWRCWHMQFILKRKTPVCQFASPLDTDVHSNPQNVVLEGKYWKRQLAVIKAEYRKWRRNSKTKATGCLIYDTKSELDILDWSPLNDRTLMLSEDWTSDTLFSAINGPFPFPDPREIARGAGIADFIQPSLGPLQPNLDDIDINFSVSTLLELLANQRLPPVPEEGSEEIIKSVDYDFTDIMGSEAMDSSSGMVTSGNVNQMQNAGDANMMELNTPTTNMQYADIEQQFSVRTASNMPLMNSGGDSNATAGNHIDSSIVDAIMAEHNNVTDSMSSPGSVTGASSVMSTTSGTTTPMRASMKHFGSSSDAALGGSRQSSNDFPGKSVIKGRISKSFQRPFRREPHNYDKAQPTLHQTNIYQQILAEQQKLQQPTHRQHLNPNISSNTLQHHTSSTYQQQQQQQAPYTEMQFTQSAPPLLMSGNSNYAYNSPDMASLSAAQSVSNLSNNSLINMTGPNATNNKMYNLMQNVPPTISAAAAAAAATESSLQTQSSIPVTSSVKIEPPSSDVLTIFNLQNSSGDVFGTGNDDSPRNRSQSTIVSNPSAYKLYQNTTNLKKSASTGAYINVRGVVAPAMQSQQSQTFLQDQQQSLSYSDQLSSMGMNALQQQQQQQQRQPMTQQAQLSPTSPSQHHHQQPLTQQQQPQNAVPMAKEMYRSNSLPLNASMQKLVDQRVLSHDNFLVPKYHNAKSSSSSRYRTRSNSIHQHMVNTVANSGGEVGCPVGGVGVGGTMTGGSGGGGAGGSSSNLMLSQQLQSATSDPMLNSTLGQLLTGNVHMLSMSSKPQSSSASALASLHLPGTSGQDGGGALQVSGGQNKQPLVISSIGNANAFTPMSRPLSTLAQAQAQAIAPRTTQDAIMQSQKRSSMQQQAQASPQQQHHHPQNQHKSPKKSTSLPAPVAPLLVHTPPVKMISFPGSLSPGASHHGHTPDPFNDLDSPLSPTHSSKYPRDNQRRAGHIHAEQKRRCNIKTGFDMLHSLIPQLQQNPNAKLSKAAMLQKGAEHIKHLRAERSQLEEKMEILRKERETLNNSLMHLHSILPANGAPVTRQGTEHVRQLYEQYVRCRTMSNWKFWILGLILEPLLSSYTSTVSSASMEELRRTAFLWVDQHCSLIDLRPAVSNKLKYLSMKTDILSEPPSTLQEEVSRAINNGIGQHPNLHGT